jgi:outer membrane protein assembly factor BamA
MMRSSRLYIILSVILAFCGLSACSSAKVIPQGEYRLNDNQIKIEHAGKEIKAKQLSPYLKQRPNRKIISGIRFHLGMYLAAPPCDSCWLGKAMRTLGEAPVIYDPDMKDQSKKNIEQYLKSRGYYHVLVQDTVIYKRHKANVVYTVKPNEIIRIESISYNLGNDSLARAIIADSSGSLIKVGDPLSTEIMNKERSRLEIMLHNKAFFSFGKNQLAFTADTLARNGKARVVMNWAPFSDKNEESHAMYKIRNIMIYTDYDQTTAYSDSLYYSTMFSKMLQSPSNEGEIAVYYHERMNVRDKILLEAIHFRPGDDYNENMVNRTYNSINAMNIYRIVNIQFTEADNSEGHALVDCVIRLTPSKLQGFKADIEASMSSDALFGISPSVSYFHKNLFKGAEYLNLTFSGNFQFKLNDRDQRASEISASPSISVPKFLFPWLYAAMRPYAPRTEFLSLYSYQYRPDYTRNSISFSFGYSWRTSPKFTYYVTPVNLNVVNVYNMSQSFYESLRDPFLKNRYENHFVLGPSASMIYTDRQPDKRINSIYLRWNVKTAGNFLNLFNNVLRSNSSGYQILGTTYAQFAKTDINVSYYHYLNDNVMLAYRVFGGVGRGYGNSIAMPFEDVYFSGGAYSLRGWQARSVGPGSSAIDTTFSLPNQVGDLKLEANIELRYKLFGALEGALFFDGGNIWSLNSGDNRDGALFQWDSFYRQFAFNSGLGLRLNFGFLIIRLDWGVRIYDPALSKGWIKVSDWLKDNSAFHFGIGYPF